MTSDVPFTVSCDFDLGVRVAPYVVASGGDVEITAGHVPAELDNVTASGPAYAISDGRFLLKVPNGLSLLVENGERVTYDSGGNTDKEIALFLTGSAWGALCYQRSLLPLHASAVMTKSGVCAFTGSSGAGKSTIAAGLAKQGLDFFTDDIVILDPNDEDGVISAYAGQRDLKLWDDAIEMTKSERLDRVRSSVDIEKFYSSPTRLSSTMKAPFAKLMVLTRTKGASPDETPNSIHSIAGAQSMLALRNNVYRPRFAEGIWGRQRYFQTLADMAGKFETYNFSRQFLPKNFEVGLQFAHDWIRAGE